METDLLTEYERYLRVPELLALQKPIEARHHTDELLFQVVHQVEELWMKAAIDEVGRVIELLERGSGEKGAGESLELARSGLHRIYLIEKLMCDQLHLLETMAPIAYFHIRAGLGKGSGLESPGFNHMLRAVPQIDEAFARICAARKVEVIDLLRNPDADRMLFAIAEAMVDVDAAFQRFRSVHLSLVKRTIGAGTPSLKGNPIELLERNAQREFFPRLWQAREMLFRDFVPGELEA